MSTLIGFSSKLARTARLNISFQFVNTTTGLKSKNCLRVKVRVGDLRDSFTDDILNYRVLEIKDLGIIDGYDYRQYNIVVETPIEDNVIDHSEHDLE